MANTVWLNPTFASMPYINVYPAKARLYLVGCNQVRQLFWATLSMCQARTQFRMLKIDRTETEELAITDDGVEYTASQIEVRVTGQCSTSWCCLSVPQALRLPMLRCRKCLS